MRTSIAGILCTISLVAGVHARQGGGLSEELRAVQEVELRAVGGGPRPFFGQPLAISEPWLVVGAAYSDDDAGAMYVYEHVGARWRFDARIAPPELESGDYFPESVSVDGDVIVAGAARLDDVAADDGAVFVFERSGGAWVQTNRLASPEPNAGDRFGHSVALQGDHLVVSAPWDDEGGFDVGAVYAYQRSGGTWGPPTEILGWDDGFRVSYGWSVALDRDVLAIGAPDHSFDDMLQGADGRVQIRRWDGAQWVVDGTLDGSHGARFGAALDVDGDRVVVGAPGTGPHPGLAPGYVRVFAWDGSSWVLEQGLASSEALTAGRFGVSVALEGDRLAVANWPPIHYPQGTALYFFQRDGGDWDEIMRVGAANDAQLLCCAMAGGRMLAGARTHADSTGAAFVFRLDEPIGTRVCSPAVPNSSGSPGTLTVFGSDAVDDDDLVLLATALPSEPNVGYFLMGTGTNLVVPPGSAGPLCIVPDIRRFLPPVANTAESGGGFAREVGTAGPVSSEIAPGSTWRFQAWHRDGTAPSNLTDAVSLTFL